MDKQTVHAVVGVLLHQRHELEQPKPENQGTQQYLSNLEKHNYANTNTQNIIP
jgi:hypothetical protein